MKKVFFAILVFALLAFAQDASAIEERSDKVDLLSKKHDRIVCRVQFYKTILGSAEENLNLSNPELVADLGAASQRLRSAAQAGDRAEFNSAMNELAKLSKDVVVDYNHAKGRLKGKSEVRKMLKEKFLAGKDDMNACLRLANINVAKARVNHVDKWVNHTMNISEKMKAKGINVTDLESITSQAREKSEKLSDAIHSGNSEKVDEVEREVRQSHLHLWARFHLSKLTLLLDRMDEVAAEKGYQSEVDSIKKLLEDTAALVNEGEPYSEGDFEQVYTNIKDASKQLRELYNNIKGG
ncbi:hypothetical protein HZC08_01020 [Candidatus Micrarchaeota archaeon]|nr:hypothetical protein [Candidatus Micrarchaeota archaeon]